MNILHVVKKYPSALGGDAVVVSHLRQQQARSGHTVTVVTSNCAEIRNAPYIHKIGLKDTPANLDFITIKRLVSLLILAFRMFAIVRNERPDVIHTHSVDMAFFASFAAHFYHIPIIHTFHIVTFYDKTQPLLRRKSELLLAKFAQLKIVTAPNMYDVKKLQHTGLSQTVQLPNGVDFAFWNISRSSAEPSQNDIFTFVSVGRLEQQKGYEYLVRAAALLARQSLMSFRIIIVGEGSQKTTLLHLIRSLHVKDIVTLVGRKTPHEIRTLLSQSNAAVFSSLYETTPITLLEAWAAQLPVVTTSVGIIRDASANFKAGFVVPPKDEQALMYALGKCMADARQRAIVAAKGNEEAQKYSWHSIAAIAEQIYWSAR